MICAPLGTSLHAQGKAAGEQASKPQLSDLTASKKGELNQANPGGTVTLKSTEVALVEAAGAE